MVVDNNNVQSFSDYDVKCQSVVYDVIQSKANVTSKVTGALVKSHAPSVFSTRYFYNSAVDKKCVQGLIARGKKANIVAKQVDNKTNVYTRVYKKYT